ncbi:MAG: hypothetical protein IJO14_01505 [Clostridia bacterium]|nr:hypothetical protein [Clostridia bacterium]
MLLSETEQNIIVSNTQLQLTIGKDGKAHSLIHMPTGEEMLDTQSLLPLCSVTQQRFYNNENKLIHTCKRTTRQANAVRPEDEKLIIGFDELHMEAVIGITDRADYIVFTLLGFRVADDCYPGLQLQAPPVDAFRLLQLPVRKRTQFGAWMNIVSDDKVSVCTMAASPMVTIDAEETDTAYIFTADANRGLCLQGAVAALFVSESACITEKIDSFEKDFGLPLGAQSRKGDFINRSVYWTAEINLQNVDEHIAFAKKGGFSLMLIYYTAICKEYGGYAYNGNYEFREEYPNGLADVKAMLDKIKAAGITPGFHFLQTHIGMRSRYMTPEADYRVLHRQTLTLSRPASATDTVLYTDQCPCETQLPEVCRLLRFGKELIRYESCSDEPPYRYTGCIRGYNDTAATAHERGTSGGVVWVSEYGGSSVYADQNTDLPDEAADKIAAIYNQGFRFVYFDGSEGSNPPFENYVPLAQYRVYKKLQPSPLFCAGAAKGHFSWHMLSGGNAFDVFPTAVFKSMIDKYPLHEAPLQRQDHTRLNFGWWAFYADTQPDTYEYGTSRAAGYDCPVTVMSNTDLFKTHARTDDIFEVMRRWEDVRAKNLLTEAQKQQLRTAGKEHILLLNADHEYELREYERLQTADENITAYRFEREGRQCAVLWHNTGNGTLLLPVAQQDIRYSDAIDRDYIRVQTTENGVLLPVAGRRYLCTQLSEPGLKEAFRNARLIP